MTSEHRDHDHEYTWEVDEEAEMEELRRESARKKRIIRIVGGVFLLLFLASVLGGVMRSLALFPLDAFRESRTLISKSEVRELRESVVSLSVWEITSFRSRATISRSSVGTGFNIHPEGLIISNRHVVEGSNRVTVRFPDFEGQLDIQEIYKSEESDLDLAVLKLDNDDTKNIQLPDLPLAKQSSQVGDEILIIGNPRGVGGLAVSGEITDIRQSEQSPIEKLEIQANIHPGHSGSPVLNEQGQVIAVIYASRETKSGEKRGIAISLNNFMQLMDDYFDDINKEKLLN